MSRGLKIGLALAGVAGLGLAAWLWKKRGVQLEPGAVMKQAFDAQAAGFTAGAMDGTIPPALAFATAQKGKR